MNTALYQHTEARADWLNPMTVKGLRRVLNGWVFSLIFNGLLVLALLFILASLATPGGMESLYWGGSEMLLLMIDGLLIYPVCIAAFLFLRQELKRESLDLLVLSPISDQKICRGVWQSVFSIYLLYFCVSLPVRVVLYFLEGFDLVIHLASCIQTAATTAGYIGLAVLMALKNGFGERLVVFIGYSIFVSIVGGILGLIGMGLMGGMSSVTVTQSEIASAIAWLIAGALMVRATLYSASEHLGRRTHPAMHMR